MESPFKCPVCKNTYSQLNVPVLNPNCGHSLCRNCASARFGDCAECPIDKKPFPGRGIGALPQNLALLKAVEERKEERRRRVRMELERYNDRANQPNPPAAPPAAPAAPAPPAPPAPAPEAVRLQLARRIPNPNVVELGAPPRRAPAREPPRRAPRCARCNLRTAEPMRARRPARENHHVYDVYHHFPAGRWPY